MNLSRYIVVADDDPDDLELIRTCFESIDPSIILDEVENGMQVLELLSRKSESSLPCLLILDYNMPLLNAPDLLAQICAERKFDNIAKVVFSTSSSKRSVELCMEQGALNYFVKPNGYLELEQVCREMLQYCKI